MMTIIKKYIILLLILLFGHSCGIEDKVKEESDAAFIEISGKVTHNGAGVDANGEGEYYVVAIENNNGNLTFDEDTDRFGFHGFDPSNLDLLPMRM